MIAKRAGRKTKLEFEKRIINSQAENKTVFDKRIKKYAEEVVIPAIKKTQNNESNF